MPAVTVIVPTLNEAGNIQPLVDRLSAAFGSRDDWEILFVDDDSSDGTGTEIRRAAVRHPVHLIVREGERGLASAVLKGIRSTSAPVVVVMDADLSHPPEVAPRLAAAIEEGADVAIGSRYVRGGGTEGWSRLRLFLSRGAALMTRGLTSARDPGAGYFAIRKSLLDGIELKVDGFKILLEILASVRPARVIEVPIQFAPRHLGKSKVAAGTAIAFLKQLVRLYASRPATHVAVLIGLLLAMKVYIGAKADLDSVEAYHWLYAQHPALGYYDHPGMIGWWIWLSTAIFGDAPLGVRLLSLLGSSLSIGLVFLAGRRFHDERAGLFAAALYAFAFGTLKFGSMATPDAPLLLFWMASIWALSHALAGQRKRWWAAAGLFLGLAMLSKYTAVFLPVGVLLYLVFSPEHRSWLRRPGPYLAALVALIVFSPTIIWNAQNDWQSIGYQSAGRLSDVRGFDFRNVREFVIAQFLLLTPLVTLWGWGAAIATVARWRARPWGDRFLVSVALPMLAFFGVVSLFRSIRGHWFIAGGATLFLLVGAAAARGGMYGRRLYYLMLALCVTIPAAGTIFVARNDEQNHWFHLARRVRELKPDFVIAQDYHVAAQLAYHLRPLPASDFTAIGEGGKAFATWWKPEAHAGRDAVIVWEEGRSGEGRERLRACFREVEDPDRYEAKRQIGGYELFHLAKAREYRPPR